MRRLSREAARLLSPADIYHVATGMLGALVAGSDPRDLDSALTRFRRAIDLGLVEAIQTGDLTPFVERAQADEVMSLPQSAIKRDLTDRECAKLIGGLVATLVQMSSPTVVRRAVRWWAREDGAWHAGAPASVDRH